MIEHWRDIVGWEGRYRVSSFGRILSLEREVCNLMRGIKVCHVTPEIIMRQYDSWQGYKQVWLRRPGLSLKRRVHRLVADSFIPNPESKPIVNHIDGDKGNSRLENLEWVNESENCRHYHDVLKKPAIVGVDEPIRPEDLPDF